MALDDLARKSRIKFHRSLTLTQTEKLLGYIAQKLPGRVDSHVDYRRAFRRSSRGKSIIDDGALTIGGEIYNSVKVGSFDGFETYHSRGNPSKIDGIKFELTPGKETISSYRPEIVALWGDVRDVVKKYFSRH